MFFVYKLLGATTTPLVFLSLAILVGTFFTIHHRKRRPLLFFGPSIIILSVVILLSLSLPVTSHLLLRQVEIHRNELPPEGPIPVVMILSGGFTRKNSGKSEPGPFTTQRLIEGASLARQKGYPILLSGGLSYDRGESIARSMERAIRRWGYKGEIMLEENSRTTWENMTYSASILRHKGVDRIVLVTNSFHMKRSLWMAKKAMPDIEVYPYAIGSLADDMNSDPLKWIPTAGALRDSTLAWREIVGLTVYRILESRLPRPDHP